MSINIGIKSKTLDFLSKEQKENLQEKFDDLVINYPHDQHDFGRCHRLLHAIPGWRPRIIEMKEHPLWNKLVDSWDELESLYVQNNHQDLYRRLEELNRR